MTQGLTSIPVNTGISTSAGPNSPGTTADDSAVGNVAWASTDNAKANDNIYATATGNLGDTSHYLKVTNFGFSVPTGAFISGIEVGIERKKSVATGWSDRWLYLVKGGAVGGTNNAATATLWPDAEAYLVYGSSSDLWGLTWTPTQINASDFGVALSAWNNPGLGPNPGVGSVDHIYITVYYSTANLGGFAYTRHQMTHGRLK
jgi:hypothetical protein